MSATDRGSPMTSPVGVHRARSVFSAIAVSLLAILFYYMSQMIAQLAYAFVLTVTHISKAVAVDGFQPADLRVDIISILEEVANNYTIVASVYSLILIAGYTTFISSRRKLFPEYILMDRPGSLHIPAAVAVTLGMLGTANLLFEVLSRLAERSRSVDRLLEDYNEAVGNAFTSDAGIWWLIVGICILVPIAEELLFRGIIQGELSASMSPWLAVFVQAVLFSAFHMQAVQSAYVFLPGLAMGIAYMASRSIIVPILMHMVFNFLGSGAFFELTGSIEPVETVLYTSQYGFVLVGLLCLIWMIRTRKHDSKNDREEPA